MGLPEDRKILNERCEGPGWFLLPVTGDQRNCRLGITDKSYAGLVPTSTRRGDKVCILHGFAVPFILRGKGPLYELVGDCYMHGMMQGEMLEMKPPPKLQGISIE